VSAGGRLPAGGGPARASNATRQPRPGLTIETIVAVDPPREFRLHPRDRSIAYTAESGNARQLFVIPFRGGYPTQITASEKPVSDPQWSPDGRRIAYVRDGELRVVDADGSRDVGVAKSVDLAAPRWSPDGLRLSFIARRRGWSQLWLVHAPVPRRGRPARDPRPPEPTALTATGFDVEDYAWGTDAGTIAVTGFRPPEHAWAEIHLVDTKTGEERRIAGSETEWACGPRPMPDGGWLYTSDADGWFQVVRLSAEGKERQTVK